MCKTLKGKRWTDEKCSDCLPPLKECNKDAAEIYLLCHEQLIYAGTGTPVDINHMAVHEAMRLYKIRNRKSCFQRVLRINSHMMGIWNRKTQDVKSGPDE